MRHIPTALTETEERQAFAARLAAARIAAGYDTKAEFCRFLGVSTARYQFWEDGSYLPNEIGILRRICAALDVTADFLLLGNTNGLPRTTYTKLFRE
jgi:transcriptional regulator with XRE-family HTH domain